MSMSVAMAAGLLGAGVLSWARFGRSLFARRAGPRAALFDLATPVRDVGRRSFTNRERVREKEPVAVRARSARMGLNLRGGSGMPKLGESVAGEIARRGTSVVFGIPGVHTIELYRGLAGSGLRHVTPRHEQGAGFMADGYARMSGRPRRFSPSPAQA
jgi:hypothetical protein